MKVFTVWFKQSHDHAFHLFDRSPEGAPLWFVTRSHAVEWCRDEIFGDLRRLPVPYSIEIREIHVDDLPLNPRSPTISRQPVKAGTKSAGKNPVGSDSPSKTTPYKIVQKKSSEKTTPIV